LPFGVAPDLLSIDLIKTYLKSLDIGAELLNDTFTMPTPSTALQKSRIKKITSSDNIDYVLNAESTFGQYSITTGQPDAKNDYTSDLDLTDVKVDDVKRSAIPKPIIATNPPDIAKELMKQLVFDNNKNSGSLLPMPYHSFDAIRCFWLKDSANPLTDTLNLDCKGDANPYLQETTGTTLGELDRLVIRSPLTGLVRYEPYYHFKVKGTSLEVLCPSNSGRLIIKKDKEPLKKSDTRLYENTEFIIENVDRESVFLYFNKLLLFTIVNFKNFADSSTKTKPSAPVNPIFQAAGANLPYEKFKVLVSRALKAWLLFKKNVNCNKGDTLAWNDIAVAYPKYTLFAGGREIKDAQVLSTLIELIQTSANLKKSFADFLAGYYVPLLCGASWYEVRSRNSNDNDQIKFPVASTASPKNGTDEDLKDEYAWLEQIYDDRAFANAILCFRGCPVAKPSKVYRNRPFSVFDKMTLPKDALTTYELEAAHLAGRNQFTFTVNEPREPKPSTCLSLAGYDNFVRGYCASFQLFMDPYFYTLIDWLQELVKETNGVNVEPPELDVTKYYDKTDEDQTHPLLSIVQYKTYTLCQSVREQMDGLRVKMAAGSTETIGTVNIKWWINKVKFITPKKLDPDPTIPNDKVVWPDGQSPSPRDPYLGKKTVCPYSMDKVSFTTIKNPDPKKERLTLSGFDLFDLESAFLARNMVRNYLTDGFDTPLPVILTLIKREGIHLFSWLYRNPVPYKSYSWQGDYKSEPYDGDKHDYARHFFLLEPYGLDLYVRLAPDVSQTNACFDEVIRKMSAENIFNVDKMIDSTSLRKYISERVGSPQVPYIQKISRRSHWTFCALMLAWYQLYHKLAQKKRTIYGETFVYSDPAWFTNHYSDVQGSIKSDDTKRRDFITYYSMLYAAYNAQNISTWNEFIKNVEDANKGGLSLRDYLIFKYQPQPVHNETMANMIRFAVTLDAYCRIIYDQTDVTNLDNINPNSRAWGI